MTIAQAVRAYALSSKKDIFGVEYGIVDTFMTWSDLETSSMWSIQWRTFALLVAEALE